ncbi:MAG: hypothetical protein ACOC3Z_03590 [Nanoarchaeota archaeon]
MSTKIYNAFKYNGKLSELINSLKEIKESYLNDKMEDLSKFGELIITNKEVDLVKEDIKIKDLYKYPLGDLIFSNFLEKQMKIGYNTPLNIEASCVVYGHKNNIYIQFFGINSKYYNIIKDKIEDFHYQNKSDMSNYNWDEEKWENMTPQRKTQLTRNWNKRKKVWDDIISNYDTFSESGLIFNFYPSGYKLDMFCHDILKKINKDES